MTTFLNNIPKLTGIEGWTTAGTNPAITFADDVLKLTGNNVATLRPCSCLGEANKRVFVRAFVSPEGGITPDNNIDFVFMRCFQGSTVLSESPHVAYLKSGIIYKVLAVVNTSATAGAGKLQISRDFGDATSLNIYGGDRGITVFPINDTPLYDMTAEQIDAYFPLYFSTADCGTLNYPLLNKALKAKGGYSSEPKAAMLNDLKTILNNMQATRTAAGVTCSSHKTFNNLSYLSLGDVNVKLPDIVPLKCNNHNYVAACPTNGYVACTCETKSEVYCPPHSVCTDNIEGSGTINPSCYCNGNYGYSQCGCDQFSGYCGAVYSEPQPSGTNIICYCEDYQEGCISQAPSTCTVVNCSCNGGESYICSGHSPASCSGQTTVPSGCPVLYSY